jgi:predicted extracellular nuclease
MPSGITLNSTRLPRQTQAASGATLLAALVAACAAPLAMAASMPVPGGQAAPTAKATAATAGAGALQARSAARDAFGQLPIAFEANHGQTDAQVRYFSRGPGYSLFLTPSEAVLSLRGDDAGGARNDADLRRHQDDAGRRDAVIRMGFAGANPAPRLAGAAPQASHSNYFHGASALRNVANFGKVRYEDLYPGVDLVYYGTQGQLEYDFVVAPGRDASPIALTLAGVDRMHVDAQGNLVLGTPVGDVVQHAPVAYQLVHGQRRAVAAQYALLGARKVGFRLGAYDHAQPLVIDPVLVYSTYHGGSLGDRGMDIALDASGNAYITGLANSSNFPVTTGAYDTTVNGSASDVFVAKFSPSGGLLYSTYLGGTGTDEGAGIAVDGAGNAYVTGRTTSLDFPLAGAYQGALGGGQDAFVTKLNASGNALVFSTYLGGNTNPGGVSLTSEFGYGIAVDASGAVYVSGLAVSTNFPTTPGAFQTAGGGATDDAFVTKFSANGASLVYSTYLGGGQFDEAYSLAVDASGNAYVAGITASTNFPVLNAKQPTSGTNNDGFLTKLNPTGTALVYSTYVGGFGQDAVYGLAIDAAGSAYVAGVTASANFPVVNSLQSFNLGLSTTATDGFVAKYGAAGNTLVYSTYLGGSANETGIGLALDGNGNAYVVGQTTSTNFPVVAAIQSTNASASGLADAFVTKIGANGAGLLYSTYLGGAGDDVGNDIAVDGAGDAYVVGQTSSSNFPTVAARQATAGGSSDAFVARISSSNDVQVSIGDVRITEGNSGTTSAVFTVSLSKASASAVTFNFATANGTATAGSDYTATTLTGQTIAAGTLTKTIAVPVIGDTVGEADEVFYGNLSAVTGATPADAQGDATIVNDDAITPPTLSVNDVSVSEGNSGTSIATFTVSLSPAATTTVGFDIATADGTALAGSDYVANALAGQTIAAGQTSKTFAVTVLGDVAVEPNETFSVNLSNPTGGAVVGDGQGIGTINNDDAAVVPALSVADVSITEGNSGTSTMNFVVNLSQATTANVSFDVFTSNNTAGAPTDYTALNATGQSIPAGQTSKSFSVTVNGDTTLEANETFFFNVANVSGATVADGQALGTIVNDDSATLPTLSINDVSVTEGNSGTSLATFTVSLSAVSGNNVSFDIATADNSATAGSDYVANAATAQVIAAGQTSKTFSVTINGDTAIEANETFFVNLANPSGATLADGQGVGTIANDDNPQAVVPVISVNDVSVVEGDNGNKSATFTVSLSTSTTVPVTFDIGTQPGTAMGDVDYTEKALAAQVIPAGQTSYSFTVAIQPDSTVEANETYTVELNNVVAATVGDGQGLGTITNDDVAVLSIAPASVTEGNSGYATATFRVSLSMPLPTATSFTATTSNGTAAAGSDYVARTATVVIDAGRTVANFDVRVIGDATSESNETFTVGLSGIGGSATGGTTTATGTILNDDAAALTIGDVQGVSQLSGYDGQYVAVEGVVTATTNDGFFLQDVAGTSDGKAETSDGIFVASAQPVLVGDQLKVGGIVGEAATSDDPGQLTLTRIAANRVDVVGHDVALPAPVALDAARLGAGQAITALERYEGMRIGVARLSVVAPVGGTIDPVRGSARSDGRFYAVASGVARPFREPGLSVLDRASHANASPAVFDGNPERLMVASLGQRGARALSADAGDTVTGMVGVLGYGAGAYQVLPDPDAKVAVTSGATPKAVAARGAGDASIASLDLRQLLDDRRDGSEPVMAHAAYATRLAKTANVLCAYARSPDIVGLAGIENKRVLGDLAAAANANDGNLLFADACSGSPGYAAQMLAGDGTRNLGFLVSTAQVRPGVARVEVQSVAQVGANATFRNRDGSVEALSAHPALLLVARINDASGASETVSVLAGQVDALEGDLFAAGENGWATQGDYLRAKRAAQAGYLAGWIQARQSSSPSGRLVVLGDFNASEFSDGHADLLGLVTGRPTPRGKVLSFLASPVTTPLTNLTTRLPANERYTVTRDGNAQAVDHILVNAAFLQGHPAAKVAVARINADFGEDNLGDAGVPMRVSDHDPVVLTFGLR